MDIPAPLDLILEWEAGEHNPERKSESLKEEREPSLQKIKSFIGEGPQAKCLLPNAHFEEPLIRK